jgi:UDP-GlcNAc:undecaprenyl-phosphate GlcNAc-1-phosphate transferase
MNTPFLFLLISMAGAAITCRLLMPLIIRYSPVLKLVDKPNERKLHKQPIPAVGGMVMVLSIAITCSYASGMQQLMAYYWPLGLALMALMITGVADDRLNLPASLRFIVQIAAAWFMAQRGIRLHSLHGVLGIHELPVWIQYAFTTVLVVGVTNAFNLLDGIDGLAGGMALINMAALSGLAFASGQSVWLNLTLPALSVLLVFLKYNWRPAKIFMGDGGSLVFGFLLAIMGIELVEKSYALSDSLPPVAIVIVSATLMIPVMDTLRVFYARISKGRSPFSADKNHLHHWLIRHHLLHSQATRRILQFHVLLILVSLLLIQWVNITAVVAMQVAMVAGYSQLLRLSLHFKRWLIFIKRMETAP